MKSLLRYRRMICRGKEKRKTMATNLPVCNCPLNWGTSTGQAASGRQTLKRNCELHESSTGVILDEMSPVAAFVHSTATFILSTRQDPTLSVGQQYVCQNDQFAPYWELQGAMITQNDNHFYTARINQIGVTISNCLHFVIIKRPLLKSQDVDRARNSTSIHLLSSELYKVIQNGESEAAAAAKHGNMSFGLTPASMI
ncbi:hypothetical protein XELAEV_18026461mg [Xenopus laevis]|uniref:Uncharacterized protein n=1 Tax=Xenopus laevis TaxID=8355 RepID=A0A974HJ24_XENLA|nr:hypothetical protein XELAEV_18026461mg [Xenopus laevis]